MPDNRVLIFRILLVASVIVMSLGSSYAQPKALGATFSFTGFAVSYEHLLDNEISFIETSLKAETSEIVRGWTDIPGVSCSFTWNLKLKEWLSIDGNRMTLFAGPGVVAGVGHDFKMPYGFFGGLKGKVGVECDFDRNVTISAFVSPVIGSHFKLSKEGLVMRYYKNGVIYGLMPEIGIKYRF